MAIGDFLEQAWSLRKREQLMKTYLQKRDKAEIITNENQCKDYKLHEKQTDASHLSRKHTEDAYFNQLPYTQTSICPFCSTKIYQRIDLEGFGLWWHNHAGGKRNNVLGCEHFQFLCGSVNTHSRQIDEITYHDPVEYIGPDVPYAIVELLANDHYFYYEDCKDLVAVIGHYKNSLGDDIYPIAYFHPTTKGPNLLSDDWANSHAKGWGHYDHTWDYSIPVYIKRKKMFWIDTGEEEISKKADYPFEIKVSGNQFKRDGVLYCAVQSHTR